MGETILAESTKLDHPNFVTIRALAAIKELNKQSRELQDQNKALQDQLNDLKRAVDKLLARQWNRARQSSGAILIWICPRILF